MIPTPPVLYDSSSAPAAPATGRPGGTLASPQGGVLGLGSDYGATPRAQAPKVDAAGNAYVTITGVNGQPAPYVGQPTPAQQTGQLMLGRQDLPTPSNYQPMLLDGGGGLVTVNAPKATFRALAGGIAAAQNKVLFAMVNGSTQIVRLTIIHVFIPTNGTYSASGGSLLGIGTSSTINPYLPLICELRRITAFTAGTALTPAPCDSADALAAGVSCAAAPTVASFGATLHRRDALLTSQSTSPWYRVECSTEKNVVVRPGEGLALVCVSSGSIIASSGNGTATAQCDVQTLFSQAPS